MHVPLVGRLFRTVAMLALVAFVAAGCGATKSGASKAAVSAKGLDYVSAKALLYVVVDTDFDGDNWTKADEHAKKFEGYADAKKDFLTELSTDDDVEVDFDKDIKPWLGKNAGVAAFSVTDGGEFLAWAEVSDEKQATSFLKKESGLKGDSKVKGVTVYESEDSEDGDKPVFWGIKDGVLLISNTKQTIEDALNTADGGISITESDDVKDVAGEVGDDTLAALVVSGDGLRDLLDEVGKKDDSSAQGAKAIKGLKQVKALRGFSLGVEVEDGGFRLHGYIGYDKEQLGGTDLGKSFKPTLVEDLPASTVLAFGGHDLGGMLADAVDALGDASPEVEQGVTQLEGVLGVKVKDIEDAYAGQFAVAVGEGGGGSATPPISVVLEAEGDDAADVTERLIGATSLQTGSAPKDVKVGGHDAKEASIGIATITAATIDGTSIFTTDSKVVEQFGEGDTLGDADAYGEARTASDAPDKIAGLLFLDTQGLLKLAAAFGSDTEDADALGPILAWLVSDDDNQTLDIFVSIDEDAEPAESSGDDDEEAEPDESGGTDTNADEEHGGAMTADDAIEKDAA